MKHGLLLTPACAPPGEVGKCEGILSSGAVVLVAVADGGGSVPMYALRGWLRLAVFNLGLAENIRP